MPCGPLLLILGCGVAAAAPWEQYTTDEFFALKGSTPEEFDKAVLLEPRPASPAIAARRVERAGDAAAVGELPESFDWRDHGAVTSVKDQGTLGTCWIFSAAAAIEGQMAISGAPPRNLSVEQFLE